MLSKQDGIGIYKKYGFNMPLKAHYKRFDNRIYFSYDFDDNEEIEFFCYCERPSANAMGNAFYKGKKGVRLVNVKELITI